MVSSSHEEWLQEQKKAVSKLSYEELQAKVRANKMRRLEEKKAAEEAAEAQKQKEKEDAEQKAVEEAAEAQKQKEEAEQKAVEAAAAAASASKQAEAEFAIWLSALPFQARLHPHLYGRGKPNGPVPETPDR